MATYKIGTRGSLLAVTQSGLIKAECERLSGESFELVKIKTQGDEVTNKPLWQLEGKDFFTKELDEALLKGEVDFVVHSYKDLGTERPSGIKLAAITQRTFAHDILLVPQKIISDLKDFKGDFKVGTSSPRRISNLTKSLKDYLPGDLSIKCETLRGNVNSRIKKLREGNYHGIVLALAGIERLCHNKESKEELTSLLKEMNYFILPQSVFPSAASQGALGIEMKSDRQDSGKLAQILEKLADSKTIEEVSRERKTFKEFGGGCHLAVGIHVKKINENIFLHVQSGEVDGKRVYEKYLEGVMSHKVKEASSLFVGLPNKRTPKENILHDELILKVSTPKKIDLKDKHVFVTSKYCLDTLSQSTPGEGLWAAGAKSARDLASLGLWVNGTADSLGTEDLKVLRASKALELMHPHISGPWKVLTHKDSTSDLGEVVGCYERKTQTVSEEFNSRLKNADAFYWTSFPQYQTYINTYPDLTSKQHFCGLGKTWQEFKAHQVQVHPVASMESFTSLLRTSHE